MSLEKLKNGPAMFGIVVAAKEMSKLNAKTGKGHSRTDWSNVK